MKRKEFFELINDVNASQHTVAAPKLHLEKMP
jgi:hypothetical protein